MSPTKSLVAPACTHALLPKGQRLAVGQMEQELEWTVIFGVVSSTLFEGLLLGHVWKEAMLMFQGACKRDEPWTKEWVFMPSLQRLKDSSSSLRSFGEKSSGQKYISWPGRVFFNLVFNYLC